ncbi:MAG: AmmeMemoRadiSam system protein A [Deltaproteobacteria bacterium]
MFKEQDQYVVLARKTIEEYVSGGRVIKIPEGLPEEMMVKKAGVFVSLKENGNLRGCIGTIKAATDCIAQEIIQNAISAAAQDPRFYPVQPDELPKIVYSVDVLMEAEPIESIKQLDVKKYGVIVRAGRRTGLLLPNLEGVDTPEYQVEIALQKAGINRNESYTLERFEVVRHGGKE